MSDSQSKTESINYSISNVLCNRCTRRPDATGAAVHGGAPGGPTEHSSQQDATAAASHAEVNCRTCVHYKEYKKKLSFGFWDN